MLKGINIVLRPLQNSDLDFLKKIENNKENWKFGSEQKQYSTHDLITYITHANIDISIAKQYRFVIDLKGSAIGFIDLFDYTVESAGVGVIISKDYRNQGFAKEALNLISDYAFLVLNMKKLNARVSKDNLLSIKLFSSCNFIFQKQKSDLQYFIKFAEI